MAGNSPASSFSDLVSFYIMDTSSAKGYFLGYQKKKAVQGTPTPGKASGAGSDVVTITSAYIPKAKTKSHALNCKAMGFRLAMHASARNTEFGK